MQHSSCEYLTARIGRKLEPIILRIHDTDTRDVSTYCVKQSGFSAYPTKQYELPTTFLWKLIETLPNQHRLNSTRTSNGLDWMSHDNFFLFKTYQCQMKLPVSYFACIFCKTNLFQNPCWDNVNLRVKLLIRW